MLSWNAHRSDAARAHLTSATHHHSSEGSRNAYVVMEWLSGGASGGDKAGGEARQRGQGRQAGGEARANLDLMCERTAVEVATHPRIEVEELWKIAARCSLSTCSTSFTSSGSPSPSSSAAPSSSCLMMKRATPARSHTTIPHDHTTRTHTHTQPHSATLTQVYALRLEKRPGRGDGASSKRAENYRRRKSAESGEQRDTIT
jgi:hypothetical protein